jgi:hypothetical protein
MDSSGAELASNDDGGGNLNSLLTYTATTSGTYYFSAGGYSTSTGAYTVSASVSNEAPTGSVTISGVAALNQTLTAANTLADIDGLGAVSYQWQVFTNNIWTAISGAMTATFTLTETQVGKLVRVQANYTDGHGTAESVISAATASIANVNDAPTGSVTISGIATQNQALTATNTLADPNGLGAISYQWQVFTNNTWTAISGATATTFVLTEAQVGKQVRVMASYTDGHGTAESVASSATANITPIADDYAGNITTTGMMNVGGVANGVIEAASDRDWFAVSLVTGTTYTFRQNKTSVSSLDSYLRLMDSSGAELASNDDGGGNLNSLLTYTATMSGTYYLSAGGYSTSTGAYTVSASVSNVAPTGSVTISCPATQTLTAANTLADPDGLGAIGYQWQVFYDNTWAAIGGATAATFSLTEAQAGKQVRVQANYTDGHGTAESVASSTFVFYGTNGDDTLNGTTGADILIGGLGNDCLSDTCGGNDTYHFGRGCGQDTVYDPIGFGDTAQFGAGIASDQLWFRHAGNNLEVSIIGASDKMTIQDWYSGSSYHLEQFKTSDNKVLLDTQVEALVQAMASFTPPASGQTTLPPNYQTTLAPVIAANWH